MTYTADIQKTKRNFLAQDFKLDTFENLEPILQSLLDRAITSKEDLLQWMADSSEVEAAIS